jgi:hypothetical protein
MSLKNPVTPPGIDPGIVRLVAQCLNHYANPGPCILSKGKAVPLQAWSGPEGSRKLRLPDFMTTAQDGGKGCQPYAPAAFTPKKYTWYSFLLEAESTPGP